MELQFQCLGQCPSSLSAQSVFKGFFVKDLLLFLPDLQMVLSWPGRKPRQMQNSTQHRELQRQIR